MTAKILKEISEISTPGFFITAEFSQIGERMPVGIDSFIKSKFRGSASCSVGESIIISSVIP